MKIIYCSSIVKASGGISNNQYFHLKSRKKNMGQSKEIEQNWARAKNFEI